MLSRLKRAQRTYQWIQGLQMRSASLDVPTVSDYKHTKVLAGTALAHAYRTLVPRELREIEFQVFSQFGDDGIIQYLVHHLAPKERTFIEFGVENYTEANTRFLLVKDKWSGLVIDGSPGNVAYIDDDPISSYYNLQAICSFITAENINDLVREAGLEGRRIGILSIDIDGVDYWVWKALTVVNPAIVIAEYNAAFGAERAITVPYRADFERNKAHPSRLYWGASLRALELLADEKGYTFIGCNGNGNNAYFVRNEYRDHPAISGLARAFIPASYAEYKVDGRRVRGGAVFDVIRGLPIYNLMSGETQPL